MISLCWVDLGDLSSSVLGLFVALQERRGGYRLETSVRVKRSNRPIPSGQAWGHHETLYQRQHHIHDQGHHADKYAARSGLRGIPHGESGDHNPAKAAKALNSP